MVGVFFSHRALVYYAEVQEMIKEYQLKWFEAKKKLQDYVEHNKIPLDKIAVSFSGGKDSTVLLTMIEELGWKNKVKVVFFNTLMEYEVIYQFIDKKRNEGWIIEETKPKLPAPLIYKKYGKPFHSKFTSEMLYRLQHHNFDFINDTNKTKEELYELYPNCKGAINWLTGSNYTMNCPKWLRQELATNGLNFKVANKCCEYLKKKPVYEWNKLNDNQLAIIGIRKAEGGIRSKTYKTCINVDKVHKNTKFFPLFHITDDELNEIIKEKQIELCEAYTKYGLDRTGCVGCPFGRECSKELEIVKEYEPNKYIACINLFSESYELKNKKSRN